MNATETLLIELNRDPRPLLARLHPMLEGDFSRWIAEEGPEIWRVLVAAKNRSMSKGSQGQRIEKSLNKTSKAGGGR